MQAWVDGGLVLPSRNDVTAKNDAQTTYAPFAEYAHAWRRAAAGLAGDPGCVQQRAAIGADSAATRDESSTRTLPAIQWRSAEPPQPWHPS